VHLWLGRGLKDAVQGTCLDVQEEACVTDLQCPEHLATGRCGAEQIPPDAFFLGTVFTNHNEESQCHDTLREMTVESPCPSCLPRALLPDLARGSSPANVCTACEGDVSDVEDVEIDGKNVL